ncbi:hypothetical protein [Mucilaginibacter sp. HD30]
MKDVRKHFDLMNMVLEYRLLHKARNGMKALKILKQNTEEAFEIFQKEVGLFQFYIYSSELSPDGSFYVAPWLVGENNNKSLVPYEDNDILKLIWYKDAVNGESDPNAEKHIEHFKNIRDKTVEPEFARIFAKLFDKTVQLKDIPLSIEEAKNCFMLVADGELSLFSLLYLLCPDLDGQSKFKWKSADELFGLLGFNRKQGHSIKAEPFWTFIQNRPKKNFPEFSERYDRMLAWIREESDKNHPALRPLMRCPGEEDRSLGDLLSFVTASDKFRGKQRPEGIIQVLSEELSKWSFKNEKDNWVPLLSNRKALQNMGYIRFHIEGEMHLRQGESLCRSFFAAPLMYIESEEDKTQYATFVVGTIQDLYDLRQPKHVASVKSLKLLINEVARLKMDANFVSGISHKTRQVKKALEELKVHASKNCETKILSRNFSHHIGSHVMVNVSVEQIRRRYRELCFSEISFGQLDILKSRLDIYITERNEFLCDPDSALRPMLFYTQTVIPFIENVLIQDNLCRSEGLGYTSAGGCDIQIDVLVNGQPVSASFGDYAYPGPLPYNGTFAAGGDKAAAATVHGRDALVALPNTHIIFSILENFIRNTAKHQKAKFKRRADAADKDSGFVDQLRVELRLDDLDQDSFQLSISDNVSFVDPSFLDKQKCEIMDANNEIAQKDLGIIDFKICAGLLNKKPFREVDRELFEIKRGHDGKLSYTFRILKPKDICLIGYPPDPTAGSFTYYPDAGTFYRSVKSAVPYQFCLIKERELPLLLQYDQYTDWLPSRILVERSSLNTITYWNDRLYPRKFLMAGPIKQAIAPDALLVFCWQEWLGRWQVGRDQPTEVVVYSEEKVPALAEAHFESPVVSFQYGYGCDDEGNTKEIRSVTDGYPKVFYDHHGGGLSNADLPRDRSFIGPSAYIPFGKNSLDLPLIRHTRPKPFWTLPYQLAEAGLARLLIIDERILDIAAEKFERSKTYPLAAIGKFWYGRYTEGLTEFDDERTTVHNIDSYWASNIAVTTHLNGLPIKEDLLTAPDDHWVKIDIGEDSCTTTLNFDLLLEKPCTLGDVTEIGSMPYDAVVIHRTFLNQESLDQYWPGQSSEDVLRRLNRVFPFVFITSGGGDVITYEGNFKFISFNHILHCLTSPENIGKQTLINNLFTI